MIRGNVEDALRSFWTCVCHCAASSCTVMSWTVTALLSLMPACLNLARDLGFRQRRQWFFLYRPQAWVGTNAMHVWGRGGEEEEGVEWNVTCPSGFELAAIGD